METTGCLRQRLCIALTVLMVYLFAACNKEALPPTATAVKGTTTDGLVVLPPPVFIAWFKGADVPKPTAYPDATGRVFPYSFVIDGKGYIGGGTNADRTEYYHDVWAYDTATKAWTQVASMPDNSGNDYGAASFVVGKIGYVCTGRPVSQVIYATDQSWRYDPAANNWRRIADFPGGARVWAVGMSLNGNGYLGTGLNQGFNGTWDWWEYEVSKDLWVQKKRLPGKNRWGAVGFVSSDGKGYITNGQNLQNDDLRDLWEYDPQFDTWTRKADMPGISRGYGVGMSMPDKGLGFVATGSSGSGLFNTYNDCNVYNIATNTWGTEPKVSAGVRYGAAGFSIGHTLYVGCGGGIYDSEVARSDFWSLVLP